MKSIKILVSGILIAGGMQAMESIHSGSEHTREFMLELKKREQIVERMMSVPDEAQKQRLYMFMNCLKRINQKSPGIYSQDIRRLLARQLRTIISEENMNNPESIAYQCARMRVDDLENERVKQILLLKYFYSRQVQMHDQAGVRRIQMHDQADVAPNRSCCADCREGCLGCCEGCLGCCYDYFGRWGDCCEDTFPCWKSFCWYCCPCCDPC
jgi:hypothetical protein